MTMSNFSKTTVLTILKENENKKVSSIIEMIEALQESTKSERSTTYIMDSNNEVFAIYCYYHKQWEIVSETEYGNKKSSKTGLNTMCKLGTNNWTKQQKNAKEEKSNLLEQLIEGKLTREDAEKSQLEIEQRRVSIDLSDSKGHTQEEVLAMIK